MAGVVLAVCIGAAKGEKKVDQGQAEIEADFGLIGDAHGGKWHRQVSLLAIESIQKVRDLGIWVEPGDFAENITTQGIELTALAIGTLLKIGPVELRITQIGKECHQKCSIYWQVGSCVMPTEGVFAEVITGGRVKTGDLIEVGECLL
jgi:MOSC domain-containing protein YiiM